MDVIAGNTISSSSHLFSENLIETVEVDQDNMTWQLDAFRFEDVSLIDMLSGFGNAWTPRMSLSAVL